MATARSVKRLRPKKRTFLPVSWQVFLARRFFDIYACAMGAVGLGLFLALASYDSRDSSWNSAGAAPSFYHNWMGASGAFLSDILLQTLGIGALAFVFALIIWAVRIYRRETMSPLWMRFIALLAASVLFSIAFAKIPSFGWLVHPAMGSAAGTLILQKLAGLTALYIPFIGSVAIALIATFLACACFIFAAALNREELAAMFAALRTAIATAAMTLARTAERFVDWVRYYNDPEFRVTKAKTQRKPRLRKDSALNNGEDNVDEQNEEQNEGDDDADDEEAEGSIPVVKVQRGGKAKQPPAQQQRFALSEGEWELPSIALLKTKKVEVKGDHLNEDALRKNAELLQNVLKDFNIEGEIVSIHPGPVVTLYELEPAPGTKTSRVISLSDDIARSMSAVSVRCAVVPGRNVIGIELPNKTRQTVYMEELISSSLFENTAARLPLILGKDIGGQPILADLARMPHLLVAGTTGSGKSVAVNTMILSLLFALPPEKCRFIMIDPKMLELSVYDEIPHLLSPVVTEPGKAVVALKWTVREMEDRYRAMSKLGVRNIEGYNERLAEARKKNETIMRKVQTGFDAGTGKPTFEDQPLDLTELPYIVVIVDEFADLMLVAGKDVENAIQRLAQMARAAGIHLIMATQRPSVDVITGVIKANFPTRISFQVTSKIDSRTILGESGAEQLLGMGDMLYMAPGGRITRVHGPFVSDADVENVVDFLKAQSPPTYIENITDGDDFGDNEVMNAMFGGDDGEKVDELYDQAVALVAREGKASTSFVQRYLQIGYNRAARIIEEMERQGVISKANATGKREVLARNIDSDY